MANDEEPGWDVSRRGFLKGMGSVIGAAAVAAPLLERAAALPVPDANPPRAGLRKFSASGAEITLKINGTAQKIKVLPSTTLLEVLRQQLNLTGAKEVCDRSACGACTVLIDGRSYTSCMTLALDAIDHEITTVEGLIKNGELAPIQQAFAGHDACQCGYCIPGFVVRSQALLNENPHPTRDEIRRGLAGNICRCASYQRIFQAVEAAAGLESGGGTA